MISREIRVSFLTIRIWGNWAKTLITNGRTRPNYDDDVDDGKGGDGPIPS